MSLITKNSELNKIMDFQQEVHWISISELDDLLLTGIIELDGQNFTNESTIYHSEDEALMNASSDQKVIECRFGFIVLTKCFLPCSVK